MIKKFYNTDVQLACEMLTVSDKDILAMSNGEVTCVTSNDEDTPEVSIDTEGANTLYSEKIFGKIGSGSLAMGHITLPFPIVNPHYIRGSKPFLPNMLGMDRRTVESICLGYSYINKADSAVTPLKDVDRRQPCDELLTGGEAIEFLLDKAGKSTDGVILRVLPVIPVDLRVIKDKEGEPHTLSIDPMYQCLLWSSHSYGLLMKMGAPAIFTDSRRISIIKDVNNLILNGAFENPQLDRYACPRESLNHYAHMITDLFPKKRPGDFKKAVEEAGIRLDEFKQALIEARRIRSDFQKFENEKHAGERHYTIEKDADFVERNEAFLKQKNVIDTEVEKLANTVFDRYFPEFGQYHQSLIDVAVNQTNRWVNDLIDLEEDEDPEDFCPRMFFPAAARSQFSLMQNYVECRLQWEKYDDNDVYDYDISGGIR